MKALIEYKFILEPNDQHNSIESFEQSLGNAIRQIGYEPELIKTVGDEGCRFVYLRPLPKDMVETKPTPPSKVLNVMAQKRNFVGKYIKTNG